MLLLLVACASPPPPTPPPPATGTLVFVSEADGKPAGAYLSAAGGEVRLLPRVAASVYPGEPAPDGSGVLAIGVDEGDGGHREALWWIPLDGGEPRVLTPPAGRIRAPSWSADGAWITCEGDWNGQPDVYRLPRAGGEPGRLTAADNGSFEPDVSASGRVAFGTSRDGNAEIYTMRATGDDLVRITEHPKNDTHPKWSPDGTDLVFLSDRDGKNAVWWTEDGAAPRPLREPQPGRFDMDMTWAPDGRRLAIVVQTSPGELRIEIVDVATGATTGTLDGPGADEQPVWSPDGAWIAYSAHPEQDGEISLATPDGKTRRRMTTRPGADWLPRWVGAAR